MAVPLEVVWSCRPRRCRACECISGCLSPRPRRRLLADEVRHELHHARVHEQQVRVFERQRHARHHGVPVALEVAQEPACPQISPVHLARPRVAGLPGHRGALVRKAPGRPGSEPNIRTVRRVCRSRCSKAWLRRSRVPVSGASSPPDLRCVRSDWLGLSTKTERNPIRHRDRRNSNRAPDKVSQPRAEPTRVLHLSGMKIPLGRQRLERDAPGPDRPLTHAPESSGNFTFGTARNCQTLRGGCSR